MKNPYEFSKNIKFAQKTEKISVDSLEPWSLNSMRVPFEDFL